VRLASYRLALDGYAAATGLAASPYAFVPCLRDLAFDRPLYLHLAALAALEGQRPYGADALLRDQLRREWCYWRSIHGKHLANYDDWSDALAYIILCQGTDIEQLSRTLKMLRVDAPGLAVALQHSYPSADRIAPLQPDLIADALLRERLAERRGSALLDAVIGMGRDQIPLALPVIRRLTAKPRDSKQDQNAAWVKVLIDGLSRHLSRYNVEWIADASRGALTEPTQTTALWDLRKQLQTILDVDLVGQGTISTLTDRGFGFIRATEPGKDLFFHSKELNGIAFDDLKVGDVVTFSIAEGEKGPAAIAVARA
jgi:CspA family cold shock protein